jgi:DNA-binding winged helix-turn-helix (wHTH) protein
LKPVTQDQPQPARVRFDSFELDCRTGELFREGARLKLQDQPARLLILLVSRAGTLVTRDEIQGALWEDGQFVEFEHAINVAVKKIREALEDDPLKPRLIETLPRKGYRFIGAVEAAGNGTHSREAETTPAPPQPQVEAVPVTAPSVAVEEAAVPPQPVLHPQPPAAGDPLDEETLELEFALPARSARVMFLVVQGIYLTAYCLALINMHDVSSVVGSAGVGWLAAPLLIGAAGSIPVRLYLLFTVGLGHPAAGMKYRRMLPYLMPWDWLWAPSPFLAVRVIGPEWALVLSALLVYPPISQLILMRSIDHHRNRLTDQQIGRRPE